MKQRKAAVLGATGMVGQRFIAMLSKHASFKLSCIAASQRSAGKSYEEAVNWVLDEAMPENVRDMEVKNIDPREIDADIVFSALPSDVAKEHEFKFAEHGFAVFSNASANRMLSDVPLIIPEVNPEHLELAEVQKRKRKISGAVITNPNCTTIILCLALKPVYDAFGIKSVALTSMQALSGAGYSGVASMEILDNAIPFIKNEEEKLEKETLKIYGKIDREIDRIKEASFSISASCNRVNVLEGHLISAFVETEKKARVEEIKEAIKNFRALPQELKLPTAPEKPVILFEQEDRPQPRKDRMLGNGMSVSIGRIREDSRYTFKCTILGHNTIRGAAGASLLNAELYFARYKD